MPLGDLRSSNNSRIINYEYFDCLASLLLNSEDEEIVRFVSKHQTEFEFSKQSILFHNHGGCLDAVDLQLFSFPCSLNCRLVAWQSFLDFGLAPTCLFPPKHFRLYDIQSPASSLDLYQSQPNSPGTLLAACSFSPLNTSEGFRFHLQQLKQQQPDQDKPNEQNAFHNSNNQNHYQAKQQNFQKQKQLNSLVSTTTVAAVSAAEASHESDYSLRSPQLTEGTNRSDAVSLKKAGCPTLLEVAAGLESAEFFQLLVSKQRRNNRSGFKRHQGHKDAASAAAAAANLMGSAFHCSCTIGSASMLQTVLQNGGNPNTVLDGGMSPIHKSILSTRDAHDKVRLLLSYGANIDATTSPEGKTALMLATESCDYHAAKLLLTLNASPNVFCHGLGLPTPLFYSVYWGFESLVKLICDLGRPDLSIRTQSGETVFTVAQNALVFASATKPKHISKLPLPKVTPEVCIRVIETLDAYQRNQCKVSVKGQQLSTTLEDFRSTAVSSGPPACPDVTEKIHIRLDRRSSSKKQLQRATTATEPDSLSLSYCDCCNEETKKLTSKVWHRTYSSLLLPPLSNKPSRLPSLQQQQQPSSPRVATTVFHQRPRKQQSEGATIGACLDNSLVVMSAEQKQLNSQGSSSSNNSNNTTTSNSNESSNNSSSVGHSNIPAAMKDLVCFNNSSNKENVDNNDNDSNDDSNSNNDYYDDYHDDGETTELLCLKSISYGVSPEKRPDTRQAATTVKSFAQRKIL